MAHGIRWSPRAVSGFEAICNHIARDSPFYAGLFAKKIDAIVTGLTQFPRAGRVVPEYGDQPISDAPGAYLSLYILAPSLYNIKNERGSLI